MGQNELNNHSIEQALKELNYGGYPDLSKVKKILVINFKNIGDVILSSPVFSVLKKSIPGVLLDASVNSGTEEVLMGNPDINFIHVLSRKALEAGKISRLREEIRLVRAISAKRYDMTINLTTGDRGRYLGLISRAKIRVGVDSKSKPLPGRWKFLTIPVRLAPSNRHYIERNLDCLRRIGIFPYGNLKSPTFFEGEQAKFRISKLLTKAGISDNISYAVVHPTSRWLFKCWPDEKVADLINLIQGELKIPVVITSGPDSSEMAHIKNILSKTLHDAIDFSGILNLRELGALISKARLFVGVDSAPMHISAAVNTPIIALFGPTSELDWGHPGQGHRILRSASHPCRPCGQDGCGGSKKSECMESIEVTTVFNAVKECLAD
ncbi:MAG: putative lipopolysaccharide heptosyltransferase III [Desulfobacterales bacterium]|nr:putative lipopolysaccharide heptosyltransferase III [Desulfobacterales bacterium]